MSSEMRECPFCGNGAWVVRVPDTRRFRPQCKKCGADLGEFDREADAIAAWNRRALLARTEAGAYKGVIPEALDETINGVVSDLQMIAAGKDQVTGDPMSRLQSQRIAKSAHDRLLSAWNACVTRPQDASGDAERFAFLAYKAKQDRAYDVFGAGGHWGIGIHSDDGNLTFREAVDAAMQAKEAK